MSDILLVRPAQTLPSPSAPDFLEKLKTLLDLREGHTRDQGSRFVTLDQLVSMGLVPKGYGPKTSGPAVGNDTNRPNPPTNLQIINNFGSHTLTWDNPPDEDLSHIEVWRSEVQARDQADLVAIVTKPVETASFVGVLPSLDYYYWIRAVDTSGNYSVWCPNDQMGGYLVASDIQGAIDKLLNDLQGQITETQLYQDLQTRIGLIDAPDSVTGSVAARVAQEASERAQAILDEAAARSSGDNALQTQINTLTAASSGDFQELMTALQDESTARINGDTAESTARQTLAAQMRGSYTGTDVNKLTTGILYNERVARVSADNALSQSITSLQASVNSNTAAIASEQTARANADNALASDISVLQTKVDDNYAAIASEITTRANADSALSSSVTTLQTTVNGHTASIQEHTAAINGIRAEWFLKTDVNGYVSGFGLENTGATSSFIINADRFAVVKPGSPVGAASKIPFVVGTVNGASTVGIDGKLVVDGTILARAIAASAVTADKIAAGAVTANKVAANAINGDHIQAQSSIKLNEGGKLTVGNNNIVLDSEQDRIVVAPDNGTIIGVPEYAGVDYCSLKDGNISFMYWDGGQHQLYNSLKRVEMGMSIPNNVRVTIPGVWKAQPKIIVSPADIMTYNKNYNANQNLVCTAEDIVRSGNTYAFTPRAFLRLTDGSTGLPVSLSASQGFGSGPQSSWVYLQTASRTTPVNTTRLALIGRLTGSCWKVYCSSMGCYEYDGRFWIRAWVNVNGSDVYIGEWTAENKQTNTWTFTPVINGLASGAHTYFVKIAFRSDLQTFPVANRYLSHFCGVSIDSEQTNQSTFTSLANGTLNYLAIGE